jgi:hypothetical protein
MQNREPLDLDDITDLSRTKVKFNHHKNRILNTKTGIFNSSIALGKELQIVKDNGFYRPYYRNFKEYCVSEIYISWQTGNESCFCTLSNGIIKYSAESEKENIMEYTGPERRVKERRIHQRRTDGTRTHTRRIVDRRKGKRH